VAVERELARLGRGFELLRRPEIDYPALLARLGLPAAEVADERIAAQLELELTVRARYAGYIERQQAEIERARDHESAPLPASLDYGNVKGLSNEARQRLAEIRPLTLGQASRVPGVTPAAISLLLIHMKRARA
jgi:tRNA uridine 5-carboxymethylaminomethyl modification enzyme